MVAGDACNRGQFISSKPSTRVHAHPGGNSSFSLGWGGEEEKPAGHTKAPIVVAKENLPADLNVAPPTESVKPTANATGLTSSNAWASNATQNSGNMLSERPSTRVHAPPGGKSSIVF